MFCPARNRLTVTARRERLLTVKHSERFSDYLELIEISLDRYTSGLSTSQRELFEAMRYSLLGGGKRFRGVLLLEFFRVCGGDPIAALPFACAVEMIHAYSLVHDDLPCMDNDAMRRGKPSNHMVYGEAAALLAGDALLNNAFETMLNPDNHDDTLKPSQIIKASHVVAVSSGARGMAGGQQLDIKNISLKTPLETVSEIHRLKTGALISAAVTAGCVLADADKEFLNRASSYAEALGLAYQIQDDLLDFEGTSESVGKTTGKDGDKMTFVNVIGADASRDMLKQLWETMTNSLSGSANNDFLLWLTETIMTRNR